MEGEYLMKRKLYTLILIFALMLTSLICFSPKPVLAESATNSDNVTEGTESTGGTEGTEGTSGTEGGTTEGGTETPEPTDPDAPTKEQQERYDELLSGYELGNGSDIIDSHLYSALLSIAREYIKENCNMAYTSSTIYNTMFIYVESIDIPEKFDIQSLAGLEKIRFYSLKSLKVSGHKLTDVKSDIFGYMPELISLDLANNSLTRVELASLSKLNKINLSSNKLNSMDFSMLTSFNMDINLGNNLITEMKNIHLSTRLSSVKLNVISNNITDLTDDYFTIPGMTLKAGVQGIVNAEKVVNFTTSDKIKVYRLNVENMSVRIFKTESKPIQKETMVKNISDADMTGNMLELDLPVGNYHVEYAINNEPAYKANDSEYNYLKTYRFNVLPSTPIFKFEYKGKTYETFDNKVTGKVKVMLSCEDGGEIMFKVNSGEWQTGNEIMCDKGGNYSVTAKVIIDGVESEEKTVLIRTSLNVLIPDVLMLILVLLFTLTLFLIVVPIVSKRWFKN